MLKKAFSYALSLCFSVGLISLVATTTPHADNYTCCSNPKIVQSYEQDYDFQLEHTYRDKRGHLTICMPTATICVESCENCHTMINYYTVSVFHPCGKTDRPN